MNQEFSFNGQRDQEKVVEIAKNHPFILFWPGLKSIFFILLGVANLLYLQNQLTGMVLLVCVLIAVGVFSRPYYEYSQSVMLVTDQRVIYVDQEGFWSRKIIETEHVNIQDVSSQTKGLFKLMLKYGDLIIRTAGASKGEEIVVRNIPYPYEYQQEIAKLK